MRRMLRREERRKRMIARIQFATAVLAFVTAVLGIVLFVLQRVP